MSLDSRVTPFNSGREGGNFTSASTPTGVGGALAAPGTQGFPTPQAGGIFFARNNTGSNVRVPYSRVVPIMAKLARLKVKQANSEVAVEATESENLGGGDLGWILSRTLKAGGGEDARWGIGDLFSKGAGKDQANDDGRAGVVGAAGGGIPAEQLQAIKTGNNGFGMGFGPDRMQRLASTDWVFEYFRLFNQRRTLDLGQVPVTGPLSRTLSTAIATHKPDIDRALGGEDATIGADLSDDLDSCFLHMRDNVADAIINITDGVNDDNTPKDLRLNKVNISQASDVEKYKMQLNRVDVIFDALECKLRYLGFFDWLPDGIVLSKLESPAGDSAASASLDARQGILFNVAIQGPAITKTWTGKPLLACLPLDKVFVLIVATSTNDLKLSGFRMELATSSFLIEYSKKSGDDKNRKSRCGLAKDEVYIGGWCIGTVLDSSASRAQIGAQTRTAPSSMALNVNVCIEWWNADRLYRKYQSKPEDEFRRRDEARRVVEKRKLNNTTPTPAEGAGAGAGAETQETQASAAGDEPPISRARVRAR